MANDPTFDAVAESLGGAVVIDERGVYVVRGGWMNGVEFTVEELREAQGSPKEFLALITRKRQQLLLKLAQEANDAPIYRQYPPSWPGTGGWALKPKPETPKRAAIREMRARDMTDADFAKETEGTWQGIARAGTPFWKTQTVSVKVPQPAPAPKKVEHEEPPVLRRKYRKA